MDHFPGFMIQTRSNVSFLGKMVTDQKFSIWIYMIDCLDLKYWVPSVNTIYLFIYPLLFKQECPVKIFFLNRSLGQEAAKVTHNHWSIRQLIFWQSSLLKFSQCAFKGMQRNKFSVFPVFLHVLCWKCRIKKEKERKYNKALFPFLCSNFNRATYADITDLILVK